jgi:D-glycero-alpha-D-manno-heptose-7-phosphate kinase
MIISRTPFRISLFGGGSDYPEWYVKNGGAVLSTTINHYCHISVRYLPPFFEHKHRIVWSQIENVQSIDQIQHPIIRECLKHLDVQEGMEIHHDGDLPARSGLGASSAFTVGLLNAVHTLQGKDISRLDLAIEAIYVEHELVKSNVGSQDQTACAVGGFNLIEFGNHKPVIKNIPLSNPGLKQLHDCLLLVFTGFPHDASSIAATYQFNQRVKELRELHQMAVFAYQTLQTGRILEFGALLDQTWKLKKKLSGKVSTFYTDSVYDAAKKAGAIGGKLCGAGGGGFMLLFVEPDKQNKVKKALESLLFVPFEFEEKGTQIIVRS